MYVHTKLFTEVFSSFARAYKIFRSSAKKKNAVAPAITAGYITYHKSACASNDRKRSHNIKAKQINIKKNPNIYTSRYPISPFHQKKTGHSFQFSCLSFALSLAVCASCTSMYPAFHSHRFLSLECSFTSIK